MTKNNCYFIIALLFLLLTQNLFSQDSLSLLAPPQVQVNGFVDAYYSYDFNHPSTPYRQTFFFNHNRHNETNINLGLIQVSATHQKYHALLGLQTGTYSQDNYAAEKDVYKIINEAYTGIALNSKHTLWLDMGIFSSHLGFESALSIENPTLTRSLVAENSPYFLTGAKLTYQTHKTVLLAVINNGWQRIARLQGNSLPSLGTQVSHRFFDKITLNWSTFVGSEYPDSTRRMRYFNNFYTQIQIHRKIQIIAGYDIGIEQKNKNSKSYYFWNGAAIITRYAFTQHWKTAFRAEYFYDPYQIVTPTSNGYAYNLYATSINVDYFLSNNASFRIEGRYLYNPKKYFIKENQFSNDNLFLTTSIAIKF